MREHEQLDRAGRPCAEPCGAPRSADPHAPIGRHGSQERRAADSASPVPRRPSLGPAGGGHDGGTSLDRLRESVPRSTTSCPARASSSRTCSLSAKPAWSDASAIRIAAEATSGIGAAATAAPPRPRRQRALARDRPVAAVGVGAQVDHRRGVPGSSPAVEHEVGPGADRLAGRRRRGARRAAGRGWPMTAAPASGPRRSARQRLAAAPARAGRASSGSGPQASGKRRAGLGSSTVTAPGSRRSSAARVARAELGQRGQRQLERRRTSPPPACRAGGP